MTVTADLLGVTVQGFVAPHQATASPDTRVTAFRLAA